MSPALNGYELGRERFPGRAQEPCPPQSPQKRERVPQDMFDPILRRFVETFPHVRLRYGAELTSFAETADGVVAQVRDAATGETRRHRGRLSRRHRRRRQPGARARRHHHERQSGADLHHQRDVPLRGLSLAARQGPGLPLHLRRAGGHLAHHRGDQRRRPLPHVDRRLRRQGDPHRGRHPRTRSTRAMGRDVRLRDPVGDAVGAARARRRQLRHASASSLPATPRT